MINNLKQVCVKQYDKPSGFLAIFSFIRLINNNLLGWPAGLPSFFMSAEMSPVEAVHASCSHLSTTFLGVCLFDDDCGMICIYESPDNINSACDGFPAKCFCETRCPPWQWCCFVHQTIIWGSMPDLNVIKHVLLVLLYTCMYIKLLDLWIQQICVWEGNSE